MKITTIGQSAESIKRKAKKLRKANGITHTEALNLVAKENGYENWEQVVNHQPALTRQKAERRRPAIPTPAALDYRNTINGKVIGQHPNRKMTVRRHARVGDLLSDILAVAEYHKRAKKALQDIRITLDTWLGCEHDEDTLANQEFNSIYYGGGIYWTGDAPSLKEQAKFRIMLRRAKAIIDRSYHDCLPLDMLHRQFDGALRLLETWPKTAKWPGSKYRRIPGGTFVRLTHNKQVAMVFGHDTRRSTVDGYSDSGHFTVGRHELTILRKQPQVADFKPMRLALPYGLWKCDDGSEVLFNRDYCPIWQRSSEGIVSRIAPDLNIRYQSSEHFYDDRTAPYSDNKLTLNKCQSVLKEWGVLHQRPEVLTLLPKAVAENNVSLLSPKGFS